MKLSHYRKEVLKEKLKVKLSQKRLGICREEKKEFPMRNLIRDQYFAVKAQRICRHFDDYELTKIAFKSKSSYMAVQDRRGFILVKDGKVLQVKKSGNFYF